MIWNRFKFHLNTQNSYFSLQRKRVCVILWWLFFHAFMCMCAYLYLCGHMCVGSCACMYVWVCAHIWDQGRGQESPSTGNDCLVLGSDGHVLGLMVVIVQPMGTQEATKLHLRQRWMSQCVVASHKSSSQKTMRDISSNNDSSNKATVNEFSSL